MGIIDKCMVCTRSKLHLLPAGRARSTRPVGPKIALRSCICVFVCVCVCVRSQLSRALRYVIRYYTTIATSAVKAIGSLQAQ